MPESNFEAGNISNVLALFENALSAGGQEDVLHQILQQALGLTSADRGDIVLWNPSTSKLQIMAVGGPHSDITVGPGGEIPVKGFISSLWLSGQEYAHSSSLISGSNYLEVDPRVVSETAIVFQVSGRKLGVLNLEFFQERNSSDKYLATIKNLARTASCAIQIVGQNALLRNVSSGPDALTKAALPTLLESIRDIYGYDRALLYSYSKINQTLQPVASLPLALLEPRFIYKLSEKSFVTKVFNSQFSIFCADPLFDNVFSKRGLKRYSISSPVFGLPLTYGEAQLGVLIVWNSTQPTIPQENAEYLAADLRMLSPIANIAAVHLAVDAGIGLGAAPLALVPELLQAGQRGLTEDELIRLAILAIRAVGFERVRYYSFDDAGKCFHFKQSLHEGEALEEALLQEISSEKDPYVSHTIANYLKNSDARVYDPTDPNMFGADPYADELGKPKDLPWLVAPISVRGRLCGQITADNAVSKKVITDAATHHANLIAACCGFAIKQISELDISGWQPNEASGHIRVFRKDVSFRFVYVNEAFAKDLDKSAGDIIGKTDEAIYPELLWKKSRIDDKAVMSRKQTICDTELCLIGGLFTSVSVYKTPLINPDGNVVGLQGFYILEPFRSLFESTHEGIYQCTTDGFYRNVNVGLAQMLGYSSLAHLLIAQPSTLNDVYVSKELRERHLSIVELDGEYRGFECELKRLDGTYLKVIEHCRAVRGEDGKTLYYEGFIEDMELRLRASAKVWEEERREHEFILKRTIGHDLAANLRRFSDRHSDNFSQTMRRDWKVITELFDHLTRGKFGNTDEKTDIEQGVRQAINAFATDRRQYIIEFSPINVSVEGYALKIHYMEFLQLLENLFSNAVTALKESNLPRYISINASVKIKTNESKALNNANVPWIILEICDNGPGVPAKYKMLQRSTILEEGSNKGVGLFIAKKIVYLGGGHIEILDNIPVGAKIRIELPAILSTK